MYKLPITYTDFNGDTVTEDFYFNMTKAELAELQLSEAGGLDNMLSLIINERDVPTLAKYFKTLILASYGKKSADGKAFIKIDENGNPLSRQFSQTAAFSELYTSFLSEHGDEKLLEFVRHIIPSDISKAIDEAEVKKIMKDEKTKLGIVDNSGDTNADNNNS